MLNKIISQLIFYLNKKKNHPNFERNYGKLSPIKNFQKYEFSLNNESKVMYGEIVKLILDLKTPLKRVLLTGETNKNKKVIRKKLYKQFSQSIIKTAGLLKNVDYFWNFEKDIPKKLGKYSLIISQAMIEHLVNPYKHIRDLSSSLEKNGYLIVHSVMPGFFYHRHPVDTLRFYPDWFEEIAKKERCNLKVVKRIYRNLHLFYLYKKTV